MRHDPHQLLFARPANVEGNGQTTHFRRQRHGVNQHQRPQPRGGRKIQIAHRTHDLRVLAVRTEVLEQIDRRVRAFLHVPQRRGHLAGLDQRLRRRRRHGLQALGHRPLRNGQSQFLGRFAHQADGPRLIRRLHRDDGVARLNEKFEAVRVHGDFPDETGFWLLTTPPVYRAFGGPTGVANKWILAPWPHFSRRQKSYNRANL